MKQFFKKIFRRRVEHRRSDLITSSIMLIFVMLLPRMEIDNNFLFLLVALAGGIVLTFFDKWLKSLLKDKDPIIRYSSYIKVTIIIFLFVMVINAFVIFT